MGRTFEASTISIAKCARGDTSCLVWKGRENAPSKDFAKEVAHSWDPNLDLHSWSLRNTNCSYNKTEGGGAIVNQLYMFLQTQNYC